MGRTASGSRTSAPSRSAAKGSSPRRSSCGASPRVAGDCDPAMSRQPSPNGTTRTSPRDPRCRASASVLRRGAKRQGRDDFEAIRRDDPGGVRAMPWASAWTTLQELEHGRRRPRGAAVALSPDRGPRSSRAAAHPVAVVGGVDRPPATRPWRSAPPIHPVLSLCPCGILRACARVGPSLRSSSSRSSRSSCGGRRTGPRQRTPVRDADPAGRTASAAAAGAHAPKDAAPSLAGALPKPAPYAPPVVPQGLHVTGRVVDAAGKAVAGARVVAAGDENATTFALEEAAAKARPRPRRRRTRRAASRSRSRTTRRFTTSSRAPRVTASP